MYSLGAAMPASLKLTIVHQDNVMNVLSIKLIIKAYKLTLTGLRFDAYTVVRT